jgi:Uma2 family endonuclease
MVTLRTIVSIEEFDRLAMLPENRDRLLEYIGGEVVEVVSNGLSSMLAAIIGGYLAMFILPRKLGFFTTADGGYIVSGERYIPDFGFVSRQRQSEPNLSGYNPLAPDLAVEVLSPGNTRNEVATKVANYLAADTVTWVIDPEMREVRIFVPTKAVVVLRGDDVTDGGDVLPGFTLRVSDLFAGIE